MNKPQDDASWAAILLGGFLVLLGVALLAGGVWLLSVGGSAYYLMAGAGVGIAGVLLFRRQALGAIIYGAVATLTLAWALWETGGNVWGLMPRVVAPAALALLVLGLTPLLLSSRRYARAAAAVLLIIPVLGGVWVMARAATLPPIEVAGAPLRDARAEVQADAIPPGDWRQYGRTIAGLRYAPLDQITPANVADLEVAWTYRTSARPPDGYPEANVFAHQVTPIKVGDTLYLCTPNNIVIALDPDTGRERWRFDPQVEAGNASHLTCRGVSYFEAPNARECPQRLLTATVDARLIAIDARTGRRCAGFGENGEVSLLEGMGEVESGYHYVTSPPTIIDGKAVLGGLVWDNQKVDVPSGVVRAFDAVTGAFVWAFDPGDPNDHAAPGPGDRYTRGTPNAWTVFAADPGLNLVFVPTGNISPDFYGAHRTEPATNFASALVALDARTGAVRWTFQTVHHDVWDYDIGSQPALVDLEIDGQNRPAVVQATKRGEIFVLDRRTGEPIIATTASSRRRPFKARSSIPALSA
jgi:quinoprotein glucose dehydrogenase